MSLMEIMSKVHHKRLIMIDGEVYFVPRWLSWDTINLMKA